MIQRQVDLTGLSYVEILVAKGRRCQDIQSKVAPLLQQDLNWTKNLAFARLELWYNSCPEATRGHEHQDEDEGVILNTMRRRISQANNTNPEAIEHSNGPALYTAHIAMGHPKGRLIPLLAKLDTRADINTISPTTLTRMGMTNEHTSPRPCAITLGDGRNSEVTNGLYLKWYEAGGEAFQDWFYVLPNSPNAVIIGNRTCHDRGLVVQVSNPLQSQVMRRGPSSMPVEYCPLQFPSLKRGEHLALMVLHRNITNCQIEEKRRQREEFARTEAENERLRKERFDRKVRSYGGQPASSSSGSPAAYRSSRNP